MKTLTTILTIAILLVAGCSETCKHATHALCGGDHAGGAITLLSGVDLNDSVNRYDLRAGIVVDKLEVGAVYSMYPAEDVEEQWGAYLLRELTEESVGILGQPYMGFKIMFDGDYAFLAETRHELAPDIELRTSIETETFGGKGQDWVVGTGPRFRF